MTKIMSHKHVFLIVLFVIISGSYSKLAPDFITPCPGLKLECLKKNLQESIPHFVKGLPSLGINSTDPLYEERINLDLPGGLKVELTEAMMTGFRKCVVNSVKVGEMDGNFVVTCSLLLKSKYKANGRILIFTINGEGDAKVKTHNITFYTKIKFEDRIHDGVVYREIIDYRVSYKYNDRVTFFFTNLFKGNAELSQTVLTFLNENWKQVIDEFAKPVIDNITGIVSGTVKKFFRSVPRDELFVS